MTSASGLKPGWMFRILHADGSTCVTCSLFCVLQGSNDEDDDDEPFVQHDRLVTDQ